MGSIHEAGELVDKFVDVESTLQTAASVWLRLVEEANPHYDLGDLGPRISVMRILAEGKLPPPVVDQWVVN